MGTAVAFAEAGGLRAHFPASGAWSAHGGLAAVPLRVAWAASHRAHCGIAQRKRLVALTYNFSSRDVAAARLALTMMCWASMMSSPYRWFSMVAKLCACVQVSKRPYSV